jgi:hypothetical protein
MHSWTMKWMMDDIEDAEMGYEIALSTVSNAEPLSYAEAL